MWCSTKYSVIFKIFPNNSPDESLFLGISCAKWIDFTYIKMLTPLCWLESNVFSTLAGFGRFFISLKFIANGNISNINKWNVLMFRIPLRCLKLRIHDIRLTQTVAQCSSNKITKVFDKRMARTLINTYFPHEKLIVFHLKSLTTYVFINELSLWSIELHRIIFFKIKFKVYFTSQKLNFFVFMCFNNKVNKRASINYR